MKFLLGQRIFNNMFVQLGIIPYPRNNLENQIKEN